LPVAGFVALAAATVAAFFIIQHLKVATPLVAGFPRPVPSAIDPLHGGVCRGRSHRRMFVSFYLLHRSDDVDVYVVDSGGSIVDTLASGVSMRGGEHPVRRGFSWNGFTSSGAVAPDGNYYVKVALIHQGRSVLVSNPSGPLPVTVDTRVPAPRVTGVSPPALSAGGSSEATIHYTGNQGQPGRILIYRFSAARRPPALVKSYPARASGTATWNGRINGRPAPPGRYLVGLVVTSKACNTGRFPSSLPRVPGTLSQAELTVR
jgi:hypothetical protein